MAGATAMICHNHDALSGQFELILLGHNHDVFSIIMLMLKLELKEKISANQNSSQDSRAQAALVDGRLSKLADCNESMKHERKLF